MAVRYTVAGLKFLRGLGRNNDREWFEARRGVFERELKAPTLALIEEVNEGLGGFAPEHVRPAQKVMMRIYRDTRFDASRGTEPRPYKTQVAGWWGYNGPGPKVVKTSGAGFYFHLSAKELTIAAGCYMPAKEQLLAIRRYLVVHHAELRRALGDPKLKAVMEEFEGAKLTRPPRGFAADTPGIDLILCRQWGVGSRLLPEVALGDGLAREIVKRFRLAAPMVRLLNRAIVGEGAEEE